ncbi:MAG: aspartate carbamoyltransferase [Chloroflexi bacterium]|nr:aspartate carbamoyltransferase [Chloroflexota bacterium]
METNGKPDRTPSPHLPFGDQRSAPFYGKDILSVRQFSREDLAYIFGVAHEMREMVARVGTFDLLKGKILANLFYEPSTRTSSSFTAAMERLGGSVIPINEVKYSSVSKGESLPDTVRTLECYADVIVLRHPEVGASAEAANYARKPIINAGDGVGEHPTQALLDLFTILEELGEADGLTVTMLGDLKYGRTVHSLARLLSLYDVKLNYVSPEILRMPPEILAEVGAQDIPQTETRRLEDVLAATDVLYVTRVQKERFEDLADYEKVRGLYVITPETLAQAKERMILMHPLPRVGEISMEVDDDPRAAYFRQMEYGLYIRMALLAMVLGKA